MRVCQYIGREVDVMIKSPANCVDGSSPLPSLVARTEKFEVLMLSLILIVLEVLSMLFHLYG